MKHGIELYFGGGVVSEEGFDGGAEGGVDGSKKGGPLGGREVGGGEEEGVDLLELLRGHGLLLSQGLGEPSLGGAEVAGDGGAADVKSLGYLFAFEAAEVAQFDDLGFAGVEAGEFLEGVVDGDDLRGVIGG